MPIDWERRPLDLATFGPWYLWRCPSVDRLVLREFCHADLDPHHRRALLGVRARDQSRLPLFSHRHRPRGSVAARENSRLCRAGKPIRHYLTARGLGRWPLQFRLSGEVLRVGSRCLSRAWRIAIAFRAGGDRNPGLDYHTSKKNPPNSGISDQLRSGIFQFARHIESRLGGVCPSGNSIIVLKSLNRGRIV
jgi:hypothetical protein